MNDEVGEGREEMTIYWRGIGAEKGSHKELVLGNSVVLFNLSCCVQVWERLQVQRRVRYRTIMGDFIQKKQNSAQYKLVHGRNL